MFYSKFCRLGKKDPSRQSFEYKNGLAFLDINDAKS